MKSPILPALHFAVEDPKPNVPVEPAPEPSDSTRKTDPTPAPEEITLDVLFGELRALNSALRESKEQTANWLNGFREVIRSELDATEAKQRAELEQAFTTLAVAIGGAKDEIIDTMRKELASLDRATSRDVSDVRGALGELAKDFRAQKEVVAEHLAVSKEIRARGWELEKAAAQESDDEERLTLVENAGE